MIKTQWTDEMRATLAGMKRAGITAAKIAERLGVSIPEVRKEGNRIKAKVKLNGTAGRQCRLGRICVDAIIHSIHSDGEG